MTSKTCVYIFGLFVFFILMIGFISGIGAYVNKYDNNKETCNIINYSIDNICNNYQESNYEDKCYSLIITCNYNKYNYCNIYGIDFTNPYDAEQYYHLNFNFNNSYIIYLINNYTCSFTNNNNSTISLVGFIIVIVTLILFTFLFLKFMSCLLSYVKSENNNAIINDDSSNQSILKYQESPPRYSE